MKWLEWMRGPILRTYDEAREELGGVPWRAFASTERWFLASPPPIPIDAAASASESIDSNAIDLRPRASINSDAIVLRPRSPFARLGRRGFVIAAASSFLLGALIVLVGALGSAHGAAPLPEVSPTAPAVAPQPPAPPVARPPSQSTSAQTIARPIKTTKRSRR